MKDTSRIINEMVLSTADVMESKMKFNQGVIDQMVKKGKGEETVLRLREINKKIKDAVELIREHGGCWC